MTWLSVLDVFVQCATFAEYCEHPRSTSVVVKSQLPIASEISMC